MAFTIEKIATASLIISDGRETICEVRDLQLQNVRFRRGGRPLIGKEVPLPLYWEQYANHEHPERNTGSHGIVRIVVSGPDRVVLECTGATQSGSVLSRYLVTLHRGDDLHTYAFDIEAGLRVPEGGSWIVTPNPHHGELEFCNFWPDGAFSAVLQKRLHYDACYIMHSGAARAIMHHHLESSDKHDILLRPGDRMMWLLEDENPCIAYLSGADVAAGVCAYMWDAHLAYRICIDGTERILQAGTEYNASFRLLSVGKDEGGRIGAAALRLPMGEESQVPVIVDGVHTFSETFKNSNAHPADLWPWETETVSGDLKNVHLSLDREMGWDDRASLRIDSTEHAYARWKATALGPAFRQPPFRSGTRYRLSAYARSRLAAGRASISIRLHREGTPGLFDTQSYETYRSPKDVSGESEWTWLEVVTPPISPAPDRVHLLLEMEGAGSCWFDNVHFMREE